VNTFGFKLTAGTRKVKLDAECMLWMLANPAAGGPPIESWEKDGYLRFD
jgi:hypothetical protein